MTLINQTMFSKVQFPFVQGEISYEDIGCYKDSGAVPRPLPELLFTDRDPKDKVYSGIPIHGQDFEDYTMDLLCRLLP